MLGEFFLMRVFDLGVEGVFNINNLIVLVVSSLKDVIKVNS